MSLSKCLKKMKLSKHEAAILRGAVRELVGDGIEAHAAAVQAVQEHLEELHAERADIVAQIHKQGGVDPTVVPKPQTEAKSETAPVQPAASTDGGHTAAVASSKPSSDNQPAKKPHNDEHAAQASHALDRLDEMELDPEGTKGKINNLIKSLVKAGVVTDAEMTDARRMIGDKDMGPEDVASEVRSYLHQKAAQPVDTKLDGDIPHLMRKDSVFNRAMIEAAISHVGERIAGMKNSQTVRDVEKIAAKLEEFRERGKVGSKWYEDSAKEILSRFKGDKVLAERFIQLIAITSANNQVKGNFTGAAKAWAQFAKNDPIHVGTQTVDSHITDLLYFGRDWDGRKTNTFYRNLMDAMNGRHLDHTSTQDMHMAQLAFGTNVPTETQYHLLENLTGMLAGQRMEPARRTQAAIWVVQKAIHLTTNWDKRDIHRKLTVDERWDRAFKEALHTYGDSARKAGFTPTINQITHTRRDSIRAASQTITGETLPSKALPQFSYLLDLPYAAKTEFTKAMLKAVPIETLGKLFGLDARTLRFSKSTGGYDGGITPNFVATISAQNLNSMTADEMTRVRSFAMAMMYVYHQDAVPFFRADPKLDPSTDGSQVGVRIVFEQPFTPTRERAMFSALQQHFGEGVGYTKTEENEITVINFRGEDGKPFGKSDKDFGRSIASFRQTMSTLNPIAEVVDFGVNSEYPYHDWKADSQGNSLRSRIAESRPGRSDLLSGVDRWRKVFAAEAERWIGKHRNDSSNNGPDQGTDAAPAEPNGRGEVGERPDAKGTGAATAQAHVDSNVGDGLDPLRNELGAYLGGLPSTMFDHADGVGAGTSTGFSGEAGLATALGKVTGQQVVFIRNNNPEIFDFDGLASKGGPIYINEKADSPALVIAGHELLHKLRQTNPDLYDALVTSLQSYIDSGKLQHYGERIQETVARETNGRSQMREDKIREEFLADAMGQAFNDAEFWREVSRQHSPNLFQRIVDAVLSFLSEMGVVSNDRELGKYFTDVAQARGVLAKVYVEWVKSQPQYTDAARNDKLMAWFGDSVLRQDPHLNGPVKPFLWLHGSARKFSAFRPKQSSAIFFTRDTEFADYFADSSIKYVNDHLRHVDSGNMSVREWNDLDQNEVKDMRENAAKVVYPVFLKAENPFDPADSAHAQKAIDWVNAKFKSDAELVEAQRLLGVIPASEYGKRVHLINGIREGAWAAIENPLVQRFIKMEGHDAFYVREDGITNIAVYKPEQIKSVFNNEFNAEDPDFARQDAKPDANSPDLARKPQNVGTLVNSMLSTQGQSVLANPTAVKRLNIAASDRILDTLNRWVGDKMTPLGNLPHVDLFMKLRNLTMGSIAESQETARLIADTFSKANLADRKAIYNYLTDALAPNTNISPDLQKPAKDLKQQIIKTGELLVKRGIIDQQTFDANKGKYLPRLYLKHLLSEEKSRMVGSGKKPDLGYGKKRDNSIPEDVRLALLGEVRDDPGFLGAMAVGRPLRDIAILDFLHSISENKDWVWSPSVTQYNGHKVSFAWLQNEIQRIGEQIPHYTDPAVVRRAEAEITAMKKVLEPWALSRGKHPTDFKQVPDTPRYGLLRGMWVRSEIYDDLIGSAWMRPDGKGWAENFMGYGGVGSKMVQAWKTSKVALNPPAQIRNFVSNMILLHLSGIPMWRIPQRMAQALNALRTKNNYHAIALKYGATVGTFGAHELYKIEQELLRDRGNGGPMAFLRYGKLFASKAGDLYQFMETVGKLAKIIDEMERGADEATAALEANKWLFDYSLVPPSVRFARSNPLGIPFITFYYKVAPRLLEVALKYPWRFLPYVGMSYVIPMMVASAVGADPEDLENLKKALPQWLRDKHHVYMLPWKDEHKRWQFLDLSYLMPWTMFTDAAKQASEGKIDALIKTGGIFSGPITDLVTGIRTGKDPFTNRDIAEKGLPTQYKIGAWLTWLYNMAMPPIVTNRGMIGPDFGNPEHLLGGKVAQAALGTSDKYGDPRQTGVQAAGGAVGMSMYPVNPEHSRTSEIQRMQMEIFDSERLLRLKLQDRGLDQKERQSLIDTFVKESRSRADKMRKYIAESVVAPALR